MDRTPQRSDTRGSYSRRFARGVASAYGITLAGGGVLLRCRLRRHGGRGGRGSRRRCGRRPGSPRPKRRAQLVERVIARLFEARIPLNRAEILHRIWGPVLPAKVFVGEPREVLRVHPPMGVPEAPLPVVRLEVEDVHAAVDLVELPRDVQLLPHVPGDGVATLQFPLDLFALRVRVDRGVVGDDDRPLSRAALGEERGREQEEESELLHTTSGVCACDAESLYPRRGSPVPDRTEHLREHPEPRRPRAPQRRARMKAWRSLPHVDSASAVAAEVVVEVGKVRADRRGGLAGGADTHFFGLTSRISPRILTIASRRDASPHSLSPPSRTSRRLMRLARSSSDSTLRRRSIRTQIASFSTASLDVTNSRASCQQSSKSSSSPASDIVFMDSPAHVG